MFGRKKAQKEQGKRTLTCDHVAGLPLAEGAHCTIVFDDERIEISSGNSSFRLDMQKVTDVTITTSTEIQKSYVSSAGGAAAGAALFGPLGAMVGGRIKEKTTKTIDEYFIIAYHKNDTVDYLSFFVPESEYLTVIKILGYYDPLLSKRKTTIDL